MLKRGRVIEKVSIQKLYKKYDKKLHKSVITKFYKSFLKAL